MAHKFEVSNPYKAAKGGSSELPPAAVEIVVADDGDDGMPSLRLTGPLANEQEIDAAIDALKKEVEATRRKAKRVLEKRRQKSGGAAPADGASEAADDDAD